MDERRPTPPDEPLLPIPEDAIEALRPGDLDDVMGALADLEGTLRSGFESLENALDNLRKTEASRADSLENSVQALGETEASRGDSLESALEALERTVSDGLASLERTVAEVHEVLEQEFKAAADRRREDLEEKVRDASTDDPLFDQVHEINQRLWLISWLIAIALFIGIVRIVWR